MTKEELTTLLRNPDQTGQAVDELNRLIEENPYFHTGYLLYLKGLQQTNEGVVSVRLGKIALNVRDRSVLYNYLYRPSLFCCQPSSGDIHNIRHNVPDSVPSSLDAYPTKMVDGAHDSEEEDVIAEEKMMSDDQLMDIIRRQLEQLTPQAEDNIRTPTDPITDNEYSEKQLETAPMKIENISSGLAIEEKNDLTSGDLIDSFLKANPKIIPSDTAYEVDLSEGLQEDPDIATETLADIYAMQGHPDKAIEIYEHLILKYPEKHIYFAAQIERLKE